MAEPIFLVALYALLSYILGRTIASHTLQIGYISIRSFTCYHVEYSGTLYRGTYRFTFSSSRISIRFHLPTRTNPRWLTFTAEDTLYESDAADISCHELSSILWVFPVLLRQTAGPWSRMECHDLRIRVKKSSDTPYYIQLLRQNIISAVLAGEIYRADDFGTKVQFSGITERPATIEENGVGGNDDDGHEDACEDGVVESSLGCETSNSIGTPCGKFKEAPRRYTPPISELPPDQDEIRLSSFVRGLHLNNHECRAYTFDSVDAQFRRNWAVDRGSFVMVGKGCRWTKVPGLRHMECARSDWSQLWTSVTSFPIDLLRLFQTPMTAADLYVTDVNVVFDDFRLRDAEIVVQGFSLLREKMYAADIQWQDIFVDAMCKGIIGGLDWCLAS